MRHVEDKVIIRKTGIGKRYEIVVVSYYMDAFGRIEPDQKKIWAEFASKAIAERELPLEKKKMRNVGYKV